MPHKDPVRKREYQKRYHHEWYLRNKERVIAEVRQRSKATRQWFRDYKASQRCARCGQDHPATIDFHHRQGAKKEDVINRMLANRASQKRLIAELKKCVPLCANCHRILHWRARRRAKSS